jgi:hypothetical protein
MLGPSWGQKFRRNALTSDVGYQQERLEIRSDSYRDRLHQTMSSTIAETRRHPISGAIGRQCWEWSGSALAESHLTRRLVRAHAGEDRDAAVAGQLK